MQQYEEQRKMDKDDDSYLSIELSKQIFQISRYTLKMDISSWLMGMITKEVDVGRRQ